MSATEKVINDLNVSKLMLCNPKMLTSEMCVRIGQAINCAIALLKEQEPKTIIEIEDDDLYAWNPKDVDYYCPRPECGKEISYDYNFCPYCGQAVKHG